MKRWEVIDNLRRLSSERLKEEESGSSSSSRVDRLALQAAAKFARATRASLAEQTEKYREECNRLFELQSK